MSPVSIVIHAMRQFSFHIYVKDSRDLFGKIVNNISTFKKITDKLGTLIIAIENL